MAGPFLHAALVAVPAPPACLCTCLLACLSGFLLQLGCYAGDMKILLKWLLSAGALLLVAAVFSGVQVNSYGAALLAAAVIALLNTLVRPVLVLLTLPVTLITLGLFLFAVNGLMLWAASGLLGGFHVTGFWAAVWGAILYSLLGLAIESLLARLFPQ